MTRNENLNLLSKKQEYLCHPYQLRYPFLGELTGHPLLGPRVTVRETDVDLILKRGNQAFNAIRLDVDNGPEGFTRIGNNRLYTEAGARTAYAAVACRRVGRMVGRF